MLQCRLAAPAHATRNSRRTLPEALVLQLSHASQGARATVIARVPRRIMLQCRLAAPTRATLQPGIPVARASRGERATVIARFPSRTVLQCRLAAPSRATRVSRRTLPEAPVLQ